MRKFAPIIIALATASAIAGCASAPLYPPRPPATPSGPVVEPTPSKILVHLTVTPEGLSRALEEGLPPKGGGTFELSGPRAWKYERAPITLKFAHGKIHAKAKITLGIELPVIGLQTIPFELSIAGEPVVTSDWRAKIQGPQIELKSSDVRVRTADAIGDVLKLLREQLQSMLEGFSFDLSPKLLEAYQQLASPIDLPLGNAKGCAALRVTGIEAGPTVLAGGFEKDFAFIVAPSITLPCNPPQLPSAPSPLANVASLASGPFVVTMPIAASYSELAKATGMAFTDGKLFFSKEYPELYLSNPEVFASGDQLVLKLRLTGPVSAGMFRTNIDGDLYFKGHPAIVDNELRVPDLEPTIDTSNFLLKLKAAFDSNSIRDEAREALKLDLGERLAAVRAKITADHAFNNGCLRAEVSKIEVTGVYPHSSYLRMYVAMTAQASVFIPCPGSGTRPIASVPVNR